MPITVFLCGDVMLGRGIDQVLPHPNDPRLRESGVRDAREYVDVAIEKNGPITRPVDFRYVWGDALTELERVRPDVRIINLETSVTASNSFWPNKGIHYRMNPLNVPCLKEAKIDCAVLANNHSLDFGYEGLAETMATVNAAGIKTAGAGRDATQAREPAILSGSQTRVLVYACAHASSGVDPRWSAESDRPGINFLPDLSEASLLSIKSDVAVRKRPGDAVIFSVHWGSNWGYKIEEDHRRFAHELLDQARVDVVYGHSSHHVRGIEPYHGKVILYGCGDFIDDYEGISGYESFRDDLALMYFLQLSTTDASLLSLEITPMQIKHFRLQHATSEDIRWLHEVLTRQGETLGAQFVLTLQNLLKLLPRTPGTPTST